MATVMKLQPVGYESAGWRYLVAFDLDAHAGRGYIETSADINKAMRFASVGEAMATWKRQSRAVPYRPDGRPNRPLTAYHATFETVLHSEGD